MDKELRDCLMGLVLLIAQADERSGARHAEQTMVTLVRTGMSSEDAIRYANRSADSINNIFPINGLISSLETLLKDE